MFKAGDLNEIWKASLTQLGLEPVALTEPETLSEPELQIELCPPLHQLINNACIPLLICPSNNNDNDNDNNSTCTLECDTDDDESTCVIDGDVTLNSSIPLNGSVVETTTITIIGVINVTGDVRVAGDVKVKLSSGATLHVGKCLLLDDESEIVVIVEGGMNNNNNNGSVLASYDATCSSKIAERVKIETTTAFDECRDGRARVEEQKDSEGRTRLTLLFDSMNESNECMSGSEVNILAIAIAVPIAALVLIAIVVVFSVPQVRRKVFPFAGRSKN